MFATSPMQQELSAPPACPSPSRGSLLSQPITLPVADANHAAVDESSSEYQVAEKGALEAYTGVCEFIDGMLRNAFSNGILLDQALAAATHVAPAASPQAARRDVHKFLN